MYKTRFRLNTEISTKFFVIASILFIALLFKNSGLYPVVFGDEYTYSQLSRHLPFADAYRPNYLYYALYHATNICGDGFLDCARIFNIIFFVGSTPLIYLTARRLCTKEVSTIVASLAVLGPYNSYTAYFMPEALYFFSFWLLTWFILELNNSSNLRSWCFAGLLLGLSSLIKPHALLFLPAIIVYIFYIRRKNEGKWALQALMSASALVVCTILVKFVIGYLLAGRAGITIFGPNYSSVASSATTDFQHYIDLLKLSIEIVKGHVLAISLMYGVPIAVALYTVVKSVSSNEEIKASQKISFYTFVILINLILVSGIFSASVVDSGPYETAARLHMRYYNFALPLLIVIAASQLSLERINCTRRWRALASVPIGAAIFYAIYSHFATYTPSFVDSPELRGFVFNSTVFYFLSCISFFALLSWVYSAQFGAKIFVYLFMPLSVAFSTFYVNQELRQSALLPDASIKAGIFTKQYLSKEDLAKLLIVGSEPASLLRSFFYIDIPQPSLEIIPNGIIYDLSKLPPVGKEWILVIGEHLIPENSFFQLPMNGFTLVHATSANTIDFRKSTWPGVLSSTQGFSSPESWGTRTSSDVVTLKFSMPLPEKFTAHLVASTLDSNIGRDFVAHLGDCSIKFKLGTSAEEKELEFVNHSRLKTITIDIPTSDSSNGIVLHSDKRPLNIAFKELRIAPLGEHTIDFKKSTWPSVISNTQGLSSAETWGTWSSSDSVTLEFSKPLPKKFTVQLVATAFGSNVGKEFVAHVGNSTIKFALDASLNDSQGRLLVFDNPQNAHVIKIDIPSPTSPKELGIGTDERRLGIGFIELRIVPL